MILLHRLKATHFKQLKDIDLTFPKKGAILIEGHNEAGKSSLFEAIYFALFGDALTGVTLSELKTYHAENMTVTLEFFVNDRLFNVTRMVRINQSPTLTYRNTDGEMLKITGSKAVNQRIQLEIDLTADALLNTCFVEQKKLEALEDLSGTKRQEAVNELLNIDILNDLREQFRKRNGDNEEVLVSEKRVTIAKLDQEIPQILKKQVRAQHCWLYRQAQDKQAGIKTHALRKIEAQREKAEAEEQLHSLEQRSREGEGLASQLETLRNLLPSLYSAWNKAEQERKESVTRIEHLEALRATFPERRATLISNKTRENNLRNLEALEAELTDLNREYTLAEAAKAEHERVQHDWLGGKEELESLEARRESEISEQKSANFRVEARRFAQDRVDRFTSLTRFSTSLGEAEAEAKTIQEELLDAQNKAATLPDLQESLSALQTLQSQVGERDALQIRLKTAQDDLAFQQHDFERWQKAQEEWRAQEMKASTLKASLHARMRDEAEAATKKQEAEQRIALLHWAEATEREAEANPDEGNAADIGKRLTLAQQKLETAKTQDVQEGKKGLVVFGVLGVSGLVALASFVTPFLIPILILGVIGLAIGAAMALKTNRVKTACREETQTAQTECNRLEGERNAVVNQAKAFLSQRESREKEKTARQAELSRLEVTTPDTPESAREKAQSLSTISIAEATHLHDIARKVLSEIEIEHKSFVRSLEAENTRLKDQNPETLKVNLLLLEKQVSDLMGSLQVLTLSLSAQWLSLKIEEGALTHSLTRVQREITLCEGVIERTNALQTRLAEKERQARTAKTEATKVADALSLLDKRPEEWLLIAETEREELEAAQGKISDTDLQTLLESKGDSLKTSEREIAVLMQGQKDRGLWLDSNPGTSLQSRVVQVRESRDRNEREREELREIRPALLQLGLPCEAAALKTHLALLEQKLESDLLELEGLDIARNHAETCKSEVQKNGDAFKSVWKEHLPDVPVPDTLGRTQVALRETPLQVEQRQNLLNLPEVDREKTRVVEEIKVLEAGMTKLENLCDLLKEELTRLLTSLGGAVLSEGERLEQFPELRLSSDFPAEIWEEKYIGLHKEGIEKQAQRVQSAGENGIEEESLDLDRENLLLQEKILELETKRRAFQMVEATRNAIVERVMPRTSEVASLLLSSLTAGRYKKMKWEGKENVLSVFDERARDYQQKKVFSGGAKDQISLSLRLGFALATLPTGNNVRPRWLFLDEPLSSFDKERTQALIKLLTQGEIHRRFDQIFLVSHSEAFDPALFEYRIRMEKGAVKWSNLPLSAG